MKNIIIQISILDYIKKVTRYDRRITMTPLNFCEIAQFFQSNNYISLNV